MKKTIILLLFLVVLLIGCKQDIETTKYSLTVGYDNCDCGVVEDAIQMEVYVTEIGTMIDVNEAGFIASGDFVNESICTKIEKTNLTGYYCKKQVKLGGE